MEKYLGIKLIQAIRCDEVKLGVLHEGYKVIYEDGYESWSPKETFEKAYRRIDNLNFGLAIEGLKKGKKVARKGWNGKGMWLILVSTYNLSNGTSNVHLEMEKYKLSNVPFIAMKTADNKIVPWLASQTDVLAEDWTIIE